MVVETKLDNTLFHGQRSYDDEGAVNAGDSRIDVLEASMLGLQGTPYSDRVFKLEIAVPVRYTFEPPKQRFFTRIYHPNVTQEGVSALMFSRCHLKALANHL